MRRAGRGHEGRRRRGATARLWRASQQSRASRRVEPGQRSAAQWACSPGAVPSSPPPSPVKGRN
eukprot:6188607-Pleurochrysis_carterae.AAC.1